MMGKNYQLRLEKKKKNLLMFSIIIFVEWILAKSKGDLCGL